MLGLKTINLKELFNNLEIPNGTKLKFENDKFNKKINNEFVYYVEELAEFGDIIFWNGYNFIYLSDIIGTDALEDEKQLKNIKIILTPYSLDNIQTLKNALAAKLALNIMSELPRTLKELEYQIEVINLLKKI